MSHFSVLVIGDDVEGQLAPYHEFECTGNDDQYVQTIDRTEEAREEYAKHTETRYRKSDGSLESLFNAEGNYREDLLRDPLPGEKSPGPLDQKDASGRTWIRGKVLEIPADWVKVEVPVSQVEQMAKWVEGWYGHHVVPFGEEPDLGGAHKYGYTIVDAQGNMVATFDRTNPNRKWDWYSIGGRWTGFFKVKPMAVAATVLGEPGLQKMFSNYVPPEEDRADQLMKGDIDVEGMRREAEEEAVANFDKFERLTAGCPPIIPWEKVRGQMFPGSIEEARNFYHAQPAIVELHKDKDAMWWEVDEFLAGREKYVQRRRDGAIRPFAVVKDGKWYERGSMGWWGCVSNEKDEDEWNREFNGLIDGLPDNTLLTVVDCHI